MGLKSNKNFIVTNAVENILSGNYFTIFYFIVIEIIIKFL